MAAGSVGRLAARGRRPGVRLAALAVVGAVGLQVVPAGPAAALPPPPPNPSNSSITAAQAQAAAKAGQVGQLTSQLSAAEAALQRLQDDVELKQENANKALVDLQTAEDAAARARRDVAAARVAANAAGGAIDQLRARVDQFAAGSFEQGAALGSVTAYFNASSTKDLLERQLLLNDISGSELNILDQMQQARTEKANADSLARAALITAQAKQAAADRAKQAADAAIATAQTAERSAAAQTAQLQAQQTSLRQQLISAQANVADLKAQRQQYLNWLAQKQAEEIAAAAAARGRSHGGGGVISVAAHGSVAVVIRRALSAVGTIYAWGGGNADGPTRGIHDGGTADAFGDFNKIGFDCSGLMVYAFAGAGVRLAHFSGYQYDAGQHVPLSQIQPGDMLFYSSNGGPSGIHHVTLYIGNGQMIEAYASGTTVRVTSVRYGGIVPYASRVL
ncbi:MAG TPA: NlpC/P60 family protein [Pseudonocardiaceae bacterium]|nr:NlpC/P60 family protein [Pseudonocardiaceae bacterium]